MLELGHVSHVYPNGTRALDDVTLSIPKGMFGLLGPNGAGKSTMLKAIMNLVEISSGYVELFGQPLNKVRGKISYVPQKESVDWDFPASVMDIALMGRYNNLGLFKMPRKADKEIALDCLRKVGMDGYKDRQISQLSGGQQQRVFLARSLAQNADIYLMDEPFTGVDAATEKAIIDLLHEMAKENKTVVVVHHDLQSALQYFDWMILLNTRIVASGPIQEVFTLDLLQETYGGKLNLLTEVSELLHKQQFPNRENKPIQ